MHGAERSSEVQVEHVLLAFAVGQEKLIFFFQISILLNKLKIPSAGFGDPTKEIKCVAASCGVELWRQVDEFCCLILVMDCGSESTRFFSEEITIIFDHLQELLLGEKVFGQLTYQLRLNTEVEYLKPCT